MSIRTVKKAKTLQELEAQRAARAAQREALATALAAAEADQRARALARIEAVDLIRDLRGPAYRRARVKALRALR